MPILRNMSLLELIPVVLALYLWSSFHKRKKQILFHIDNLALVSIINKRTSKDKQIMKLVRPLVLLTMLNDIQFKARHINTTENSIAKQPQKYAPQPNSRLPELSVSSARVSLDNHVFSGI
jgi:hypothetical protein